MEDCNAGNLSAALGDEPLLQSIAPTPSPVVDSTTEAPSLGFTEAGDGDDDGDDEGDDDDGDDYNRRLFLRGIEV